jgi:predicted amidohydrolase
VTESGPHDGAPRVAVVQSSPRLGEAERNLRQALEHIEALGGEADLVVFPELFSTGYSLDAIDHRALAEAIPGGSSVQRLSAAAAHSRVAVCGGLLERDGDRVYDTAVVIDANGAPVARYRKSHLHPSEVSTFAPGHELTVAPIARGINLGVAICFEHAFPEIFAELALAGANVIAIPSAVPEGFGYLLELRTRARAQDNQVFVAAANLAGDDGKTKWCGCSAIVNPRGEVLAFGGLEREARLSAELELALVDAERRQEPVFQHRRPELYGHLRSPDGAAIAGLEKASRVSRSRDAQAAAAGESP